ncbi:MAG: UDP-N-acetylmuramoyl-tripeptide--D-alanyl-D-alanine ligase [Plesiomonas sp.]|uniref:UDP-N-acetylmuramoyl-tripeptide--D-alanyl-D- alanine ligase n=1 Tax=Plesiomonas sp. TaxID=2486279 RepID=UPI003F385B8C
MIPLTLGMLADVVGGQLSSNQASSTHIIEQVTTDTRQLANGGLFIALRGERFDAHDFARQAVERGAQALLVDHYLNDYTLQSVPQCVVADTRIALGLLGKWVRQQSRARVVAMTGSSGKTTVKEMTAAILRQRGSVLSTAGNFNNDIGVPLTLLRLTAEHDYAVIELGANHIGEIAYTTALVQPEVALVNNVMAAHLEGFGSLAGVHQAKGEIYQGLPEGGIAIVNLDIADHQAWQPHFSGKSVNTWSLTQPADYHAENISTEQGVTQFTLCTPQGKIAVILPYPGQHNIANALAAAALSLSVGASLDDVAAGLLSLQPVKGRLFPLQITPQLLVIDDTYNANVGSMQAAIKVLAQQPGVQIFVVGDMGELGPESLDCHQEVGVSALQASLTQVMSVGSLSAAISAPSHGQHFADKSALIAALLSQISAYLQEKTAVTVLVKGSRSAAMEQVVQALQETYSC